GAEDAVAYAAALAAALGAADDRDPRIPGRDFGDELARAVVPVGGDDDFAAVALRVEVRLHGRHCAHDAPGLVVGGNDQAEISSGGQARLRLLGPLAIQPESGNDE